MKVAVIGATGYVGKLLVQAHAARGDIVHALARAPSGVPALHGVTVHAADVTAAGAIPDAFFDDAQVVYHCAAEIANEARMRAVNVDATRALLQRARGKIGRWVQLSSLSVYGTPRTGVIDENSTARPRSLYAQTKLASDEAVVEAARDAFTYTLVRPAAVIGRHMRSGSMRALIEAVACGRFCFIGPRGAIGNFVHEINMVDALLLCATHDAAVDRTYNLSQNVTLEAMAAAIAEALGCRPPRARIPEALARLGAQVGRLAPAFPLTPARVDALTSRVEYRSTRIERELGYRTRATIEDALRDLVADRKRLAP